VFENPRFATANATTELAGPASSIGLTLRNGLAEEGVAESMRVKVHLENPLLGKGCYIGSNADPIVFQLTTGTTDPPPPNKPIKGNFGFISQKDEFNFVEVIEHTQVDNTFSTPAAMGCGGPFASIIDPLINSKIGLPSPAGYNTIIHNGFAAEGTTAFVIASEQEEPNEKHHEHKEDQDNGPHHWWH
jgi:hypothetical protein